MTDVLAEEEDASAQRTFSWRRLAGWQKASIVLLTLFAVLCGGLATAGYGLLQRYEDRVQRQDLLGDASQPGRRPDWEDDTPLNLLLLGSDFRDEEPDAGERSDTVMLVHISARRDEATVLSIPRDSYVNIPAHGDHWPGGMNKLNAAFAFGGAPLAATTITELTGLPLHGALVANLAAVRDLVDAVGGVSVCVPYQVISAGTDQVWPAGCHQLDGASAAAFVRQRQQVPGGDFGRIHNQQLVLNAIAKQVTAQSLLSNPLLLDRLLVTAAEALVVDQRLDLRKLALSVRKIKPANVRYLTVPHTNPGLVTTAGSAVELDTMKAHALFAAIRDDNVAQWLADNPQPPGT